MKLSIVTTLYCSAPYIAEYVERMSAAAQKIAKDDYEIVVVNDGSPDDAVEIPVDMQAGDVLFFNGQIVHGSLPNTTTDRFRRSLIGDGRNDAQEEPGDVSEGFGAELLAGDAEVGVRDLVGEGEKVEKVVDPVSGLAGFECVDGGETFVGYEGSQLPLLAGGQADARTVPGWIL